MSLQGVSKPLLELVKAGERRTVAAMLRRGMRINLIAAWMGVEPAYVIRLINSGEKENAKH